jgi:5-methylcytosine-specific restriction protein A
MPNRIPSYRPPGPRVDALRPNSAARGYDRRWRKYRRWFLSKNPLCVECVKEGRPTLAVHVDHVEPVEGGQADPLFWEETNHQGLCQSHHSRKTAREKGSRGRPAT